MALSLVDAIGIFALANPELASKLNTELTEYWEALGGALTKEQQLTVSKHYKQLPKFLSS